ncbi:glycosyltransferase [Sediminibacterium salmoneum]|uniref:glycosyltransferase n=1 Tax=Sediminibacterium salmoneum TaxID=426421 RepID=UPI00047B1AE4|nr:glycosyltransferase [Sediminibacterium salmoneum]
MKIAIVLPNGLMGGAEQFLINIAIEYSKRGTQVSIFLLTNLGYLELFKKMKNYGIDIYTTPAKREIIGVFIFPFLIVKHYRRFDKVFTSHTHINFLIGILRFLKIVRAQLFIARESTVIFQRYSGTKLVMFKIFMKTGYLMVDYLICQTEFMRSDLLMHMPSLGKKMHIVVMHNPINVESIEYNLQFDVDLHLQAPYIVAAGSLRDEKGFDILIEAFKIISEKFPELSLVILGSGVKFQILQKMIHDLELTKSVFLLGQVDNVFPYFKNAKVCVVSSRIEGFPNVLLQMMYCNSNVVSTLCADGILEIPQILTCEPNDISGLAFSISKAYSSNFSTINEYHRSYLSQFHIEQFVDKINAFH